MSNPDKKIELLSCVQLDYRFRTGSAEDTRTTSSLYLAGERVARTGFQVITPQRHSCKKTNNAETSIFFIRGKPILSRTLGDLLEIPKNSIKKIVIWNKKLKIELYNNYYFHPNRYC